MSAKPFRRNNVHTIASTENVHRGTLCLVQRAAFTRCVGFSLGVVLAAPTLAFAQDTPSPASDSSAQQSAYRTSIAQEGILKQTDKIQAEITELISELKLNGMDGADLTVLTNASSHLQSLSQEDMQKVVNALQSASMNTQEQGRQQSLVTAYEGQKTVSLKLKSLAAEMAAQESQKEIPSKLENLIARQSANLRQTSTLSAVASVAQLNAAQKTTHDIVSAEQTAIGGEIDLLVKVLAAKPETPPAEGVPDTAKQVLDAMNGGSLPALAQAATQSTSAGPFPDAVTKQTSVRDLLTSVLRTAMANVDAVSQLEQVKAELNQVTGDQKDVSATAQESKLDGATLAERQAKIEDRTSVIQALLKALSPGASTQLEQAQQEMDKSSSALEAAKNPADTAPQQQAVVDALAKTSALLDTQIASAEKEQAASPTDKLAQLQQLQSEISQTQQNPQASATDMQKLQQDAAAVSPQAANKIADATDQMQKPQPDSAAAQQDLAQANSAVQQQEDALKQEAQAYQALNQESQQLTKAQQAAAAANQAIQQSTSGDLTQAAKDLTQAQAAVDQMQQTPPTGGLPTGAQQALQQASDALKAATMQAVQAQGAGAQAQDQQAMAAMGKAQAGLGQAMAQIQQQAQGQGQGQGQNQTPGQGQGQPAQPGQIAAQSGTGEAAPQESNQVLGGTGAGGVAQVMGGLKPKDRDAISQYQAEKSPPEYAPLVQQYLKNLADSSQNR
jgi:hypothetical protein